MAVAKENAYDSLKRAPSYSGSYTVSLSGGSTLSIEDLGSLDIGAFMLQSVCVLKFNVNIALY